MTSKTEIAKIVFLVAIYSVIFYVLWRTYASQNNDGFAGAGFGREEEEVRPTAHELEEKEYSLVLPEPTDIPQRVDVSLNLNRGEVSSDSPTITIQELCRRIREDNKYLKDIITNCCILTDSKIARYTALINMNQKDPNAKSKISFLTRALNSCIRFKEFISTKPDIYKKRILAAICDPEKGIVSIKGESREKFRNGLIETIHVLSKGSESFNKSFMNYCITAPAGMGKTKAAEVISYVFSKIGILATNSVLIANKSNFKGLYVGESEKLTNNILFGYLEGVVFLDEAYSLSEGNIHGGGDTYDKSIVSILVDFLDKYVGFSVFIIAGYTKEMADFFSCNKGLDRRFPNRYELPPYTPKDILFMLEEFIKEKIGYVPFKGEVRNFVYTIISFLDERKVFSNFAGDYKELCNSFIKSLQLNFNNNSAFVELNDMSRTYVRTSFNNYLKHKNLNIVISDE